MPSIFKYLLLIIAAIIFSFALKSSIAKNIIGLLDNQTLFDVYFEHPIPSPDSPVVLINAASSPTDSIIRAIEIISFHEPAVVGVDYIFGSEMEPGNKENMVNLVLPVSIDDQNRLVKSTNIFQKSADYGSVDVNSGNTFEKSIIIEGQTYYTFGLELLKHYDIQAFNNAIKRPGNEEYINYNSDLFFYNRTELQDILDGINIPDLKNKIVIIGYLGNQGNYLPTQNDCIDSHDTPVGKVYGAIIIANIINTLNNNFIDSNFYLNLFLNLLILVIIVFVLFKISRFNFWIVLITGHFLLIVVSLALMFLGIYILSRFHYLMDIQSPIISMIVLSELMIIRKYFISE